MFEKRSFTIRDTDIPVRHTTGANVSTNKMLIELGIVVLHTCGLSTERANGCDITKFTDGNGDTCVIAKGANGYAGFRYQRAEIIGADEPCLVWRDGVAYYGDNRGEIFDAMIK